MSQNRQPLTAFHFRVSYKGLEGATDADTQFQSITGLKAAAGIAADPDARVWDKKLLPTIFNLVVLRRAIDNKTPSPLRNWVMKCLNGSSPDRLAHVQIEVLDEEHKPQMSVRLSNVTAAGWELGELNAEKSELLMEEITLKYESIELLK